MCDIFTNKYGFEPVDDECVQLCAPNKIIIPKLVRYLGMGTWQALGDVNDSPGHFLIFCIGGPSGFERENSLKCMNELTIQNSIDLAELKSILSKEEWCTTSNPVGNDDVIMQQIQTHYPSEESDE